MQGASVNVPATVALKLAGRKSYRRKYGSKRRSYRRKSTSARGLSYYQKRAIARKAYVRGKWPSSQWAHPYIRRGGSIAQAMGMTPGATFQEAGPEEQEIRRAAGYYGRGK